MNHFLGAASNIVTQIGPARLDLSITAINLSYSSIDHDYY